jgi:hypothetical protein
MAAPEVSVIFPEREKRDVFFCAFAEKHMTVQVLNVRI